MAEETKIVITTQDKKEGELPQESFFPFFFPLYKDLSATLEQSGKESPLARQKAKQLRQQVVEFWKTYIERKHPKGQNLDFNNLGSFNRDEEGKEQSALCEQILTANETTILKWGLTIDGKSKRKPTVDILTMFQYPGEDGITRGGFPQFHIIILGNDSMTIEYTHSPKDKKVTIKFELEDLTTTSVNQALLPPNSFPRLTK